MSDRYVPGGRFYKQHNPGWGCPALFETFGLKNLSDAPAQMSGAAAQMSAAPAQKNIAYWRGLTVELQLSYSWLPIVAQSKISNVTDLKFVTELQFVTEL